MSVRHHLLGSLTARVVICLIAIGQVCVCLASTKNILFLLADDAGFELGTYNNKICQTPNIDALAHKSLIFNNAHTAVSSCSPSRAAILTGLPPHQNGMYGLHNGVHNFNSLPNQISLTERLRAAGIRSGLIGKKHIGGSQTYKFDFERTEEEYETNQIGRNITNIKLMVRQFLNETQSNESFFLMVGFHDPHRCGDITPQFGSFCERWGSGEIGMGTIPDWHPIYYQWDEIDVPYNVPDTEPARRDLSAQYTTISRLDQGVGLVIRELIAAGYFENTLIVYTSDNGPSMPAGRTNLYEPGVRVPLLMSSPFNAKRKNQVTYAMSSHLDLLPTFLDWYSIIAEEENSVDLLAQTLPKLTGKSLLPLLDKEPANNADDAIYFSHNLHEITMSYPMRAIKTKKLKLIHNIGYRTPFPIDQDFYVSPTFQDILNRTIANKSIPWYKTLRDYYYRPEWELFDLYLDPAETVNVANKSSMGDLKATLMKRLRAWQAMTDDPWQCAPDGVLENRGVYKTDPQCLTLGIK